MLSTVKAAAPRRKTALPTTADFDDTHHASVAASDIYDRVHSVAPP